jgi:hypothetical protein
LTNADVFDKFAD